MNSMDRFYQALCNLSDPEQERFRHRIAESAKCLPDEAKLRSRLCVAVLDALGCPHDGKGHRLEDRPPYLEPEEATQRIMALSSQIPFAETVQTTAQCPVSTTMTATQFSTDPATRVQALRGQMDTLITDLQGMVAELQAGRLPDMTAIASAVEPLRTEFATLVTELRPTDESLEGLTAALHARAELTTALAMIDRLVRLRHRQNREFFGIAQIRQRCADVRQMVIKVTSLDEAITEVLKPLRALERLVDEYESLDEVVIEELDAAVRGQFGAQIGIAAIRGYLEFAEPDAVVPAESGESGNRFVQKVSAGKPPGATLVDETTAPSPLGQAVNQTQSTLPTKSVPQGDETTSASTPSTLETVSTKPAISPDVSGVIDLLGQAQKAGDVAKPQVEPVVLSTTPPNALFNKIDERLRSFDTFRQAFWLDPFGQVVEAPWYEKDRFALRIRGALDKALSQYEFGKAFLFVQVLDSLSQLSGWVLDDLDCAEAISESPRLPGAGLSNHRAQRIREAAQQGRTGDDLRLAIFLEAVRPNPEYAGSIGDLERLIKATFDDQNLVTVVTYLFRANAVGIDPISLLSIRLSDSHALSRTQLEAELRQRCQQLRIELVRLWSAAGGRIEHTHCRDAWKRFMEEIIRPLRDQFLAPDDITALLAANLPELRIQLRRLSKSYTRIMDGAGVRMKDRNAADRTANELEREFGDILGLVEKLRSLADSTARTAITVPTTEVLRLLNPPLGLEPVEELCRQIFRYLVGHRAGYRPLRLDARLLRDCPALLGEIDPESLRDPQLVCDGLPMDMFRPPRFAVAALLADLSIQHDASPARSEDLLPEIRDRALEAARRPDLLSCLSAVPHLLETQDRNRLHRLASDLGDEVFQAGQTLAVRAQKCQDLMAPACETLQPAAEEAQRRAGAGITSTGFAEGLLLKDWIDRLSQIAAEARDSSMASYRQAAESKSPAMLEMVKAAIERDDLRRIPLLLNGQESAGESSLPAIRRTPWRTQERVREITPRFIEDVEQRHQDSGEEIRDLIEMWVDPSGNPMKKKKLRRLFYRFISGEEGINRTRRQKVFPDGLVRGGFDGFTIQIQCKVIRKMLRQFGLNPTFLPQLADYSDIVLLSPPQTSLLGTGIAMDWAKSASAEGPNALVVFLAPKLSPTRRSEILSAFRARRLNAVLIDDFDFWRLVMVDDSVGHDFVPFLEVVMEQFDLERVSPFSSQDGQHVRLETYVGRQDAARRLARTADYTRVFSGRKLGKSALLKHVEVVHDNSKLPSGNTLNVLFITIAGGDSEEWIVNQIIAEMGQRFDLAEASIPDDISASERFSRFVSTFVEQCPHDSLLVILDEADQFVEGQLVSYNRDREKSLSFKMMKELPTRVDSHGLPRVRVILSGYRVTNTREGVWANAGDVLRLVPLQEAEATEFIQGTLARIGVDITEHASFVARRCGFQPAILIRFGQSLLNRLQSRRSLHSPSGYIRVSHDEVASTFNDLSIIEEIRTVVDNNFQGNRVGGVIFGAMLLAMKELPPGFPLREAPQRTLEKLLEIEPDLSWLIRIDPTPEAEIKRNLQDFIDRELLIKEESSAGDEEYRLRFPHYLPVLTQQADLPQIIRQRIHALMQTSPVRRRGGSILADSSLTLIRYWYDKKDTDVCRLVFVGGGWLSALEHPKVGIADRLGCKVDKICRYGTDIVNAAKYIRVYSGLDAHECTQLATLPLDQPAVVVGGIDTLRWALHQNLEGTDFLVETIPIQRITEDRIAWWFEDARALHFESPDALARITANTGGIPFLLERFDALLPHSDGSEVAPEELRRTLIEFDAKFASFAEELRSGIPSIRLLAREIELLTMLVLIASEGLNTQLGQEFCDNWALCQGDGNNFISPYDDPGDDLALRVLISSGFLTVNEKRQVQIQAESAESRLVKAWRESVAG